MATTLAVLVAGIVLVFAGSDTAFVAPLTPVWSKPLGKGVRFVGVEEYGRCILFVDNGAIQVVLPSGETAWSWPYSKISRYINPRHVAVSHDCDAIAVSRRRELQVCVDRAAQRCELVGAVHGDTRGGGLRSIRAVRGHGSFAGSIGILKSPTSGSRSYGADGQRRTRSSRPRDVAFWPSSIENKSDTRGMQNKKCQMKNDFSFGTLHS